MSECPTCKGEPFTENLVEAIFTLAALQLVTAYNISPDQAARQVAQQRHEVWHALAEWSPPAGSYRAEDAE